jgi:hypothetical protein
LGTLSEKNELKKQNDKIVSLAWVYPEDNLNRAARFFLVKHTKTGEMYQMTTKSTKCPLNNPTSRRILQMDIINYTNIFYSKALLDIPKSFFGMKKYYLATKIVK